MGQGQCGGDVLLILSLLASGDCQYTCHKTDKTPRTETREGLERWARGVGSSASVGADGHEGAGRSAQEIRAAHSWGRASVSKG